MVYHLREISWGGAVRGAGVGARENSDWEGYEEREVGVMKGWEV